MGKNKKSRVNVVYSTNPNFGYDEEELLDKDTLDPEEQLLYVSLDRKQRGGKEVTIVEGFVGGDNDLKELAKFLKSKCGVGGAVKNGQILVQGKFKDKVASLLEGEGYCVKKKGGN